MAFLSTLYSNLISNLLSSAMHNIQFYSYDVTFELIYARCDIYVRAIYFDFWYFRIWIRIFPHRSDSPNILEAEKIRFAIDCVVIRWSFLCGRTPYYINIGIIFITYIYVYMTRWENKRDTFSLRGKQGWGDIF